MVVSVATAIAHVVLVTQITTPLTVLASHTEAPPSGLGFIAADEATVAEVIMVDTEVVTVVGMDTVVTDIVAVMGIVVVMVIDDKI